MERARLSVHTTATGLPALVSVSLQQSRTGIVLHIIYTPTSIIPSVPYGDIIAQNQSLDLTLTPLPPYHSTPLTPTPPPYPTPTLSFHTCRSYPTPYPTPTLSFHISRSHPIAITPLPPYYSTSLTPTPSPLPHSHPIIPHLSLLPHPTLIPLPPYRSTPLTPPPPHTHTPLPHSDTIVPHLSLLPHPPYPTPTLSFPHSEHRFPAPAS